MHQADRILAAQRAERRARQARCSASECMARALASNQSPAAASPRRLLGQRAACDALGVAGLLLVGLLRPRLPGAPAGVVRRGDVWCSDERQCSDARAAWGRASSAPAALKALQFRA